MTDPASRPLAVISLVAALATVVPLRAADNEVKPAQALAFATEMARGGNWREARYRWQAVAKAQPNNAHVLNNLAVAAEALGEHEEASKLYVQALETASDPRIADNQRRSATFWRQHRAGTAPEAAPDPGPPGESGKSRGKVLHLPVRLLVPARLELAGRQTLLVASFLAEDRGLLDINRELTRFLRNEFHKGTALQVLDVTPPPAVPEQRADELAANAAFWKHLGQVHGADIIVSGTVSYDRQDASGFRDVDVISSVTGQKVRETRFVEEELFQYTLDIFYLDGKSGELLHREKLKKGVRFRGLQNDPITAFYEISDSLAADVLAVLSPRMREDMRFVFRS